MTASGPDDPPPTSGTGSELLDAVIGALVHGSTVGIDGSSAEAVVEMLAAAGLDASTLELSADPHDVMVSLGAVRGSSAEEARHHVEVLAAQATRAVVFSPAGSPHRFAAWWDDLFALHGFEPLDVLRAELWEDPSWEAAALSNLVLYVEEAEASRIGQVPPSRLPRSAVHPGMLAPAARESAAIRELAARLGADAGSALDAVRIIEEHLAAVEASAAQARDELRVAQEEAQQRIDAVEAAARAEVALAEQAAAAAGDDARSALAQLERAEDARRRAERQLATLRAEVDAIVAAAAAPRDQHPSRMRSVGRRVSGAVGRRVELRALAAVDRLGDRPDRLGVVAQRAAAVYRSSGSAVDATRELFDTDHYLDQRPGQVGSGLDPVLHYARVGWRLGLDPHPLFDTDWYLRANPALIGGDVSPLEHFMAGAWREGCDPHPLFDCDFYLRHSKDVAVMGTNPLVHYLHVGWREGRDPHPLFRTNWYRDRNPGVEAVGMCPLVHYVLHGWREGRSPSELFDAEWYVSRHPEVEASGLAPYRYYLEVGVRLGDDPSPWVAELRAITDEPDVSEALG